MEEARVISRQLNKLDKQTESAVKNFSRALKTVFIYSFIINETT